MADKIDKIGFCTSPTKLEGSELVVHWSGFVVSVPGPDIDSILHGLDESVEERRRRSVSLTRSASAEFVMVLHPTSVESFAIDEKQDPHSSERPDDPPKANAPLLGCAGGTSTSYRSKQRRSCIMALW